MKIGITVFFLAFFALSCQSQQSQPAAAGTTPPAAPMAAAPAPAPGAPFTNLGNAEFKALMGGSDVVLLDVRTPAETAQGKIDGAMEINISSPDFASKIAELDKDKTYLVYCRSGARSARACNMMADAGFSKLYNLSTGFMNWR